MPKSGFFQLNDLERQRTQVGKRYFEFLRLPAMSAGVYGLSAGGIDTQSPRQEDELYYVVRGRARMKAGSEEREVTAGTLIFVAREVEHRFYDIEEDLMLLVFFAPAETA